MTASLNRFLDAQNQLYLKALSEIRNGRKESHWMWFIFPQLDGLGRSETAKFYALRDLAEAQAFLSHPVLGKHLQEISRAVMSSEVSSAGQLFGHPDDLKLRSCMTLFSAVPDAPKVFQNILDKYFDGVRDSLTDALLERQLP